MRSRDEVLKRLEDRVIGTKNVLEAPVEILHDILVTLLDIRDLLIELKNK